MGPATCSQLVVNGTLYREYYTGAQRYNVPREVGILLRSCTGTLYPYCTPCYMVLCSCLTCSVNHHLVAVQQPNTPLLIAHGDLQEVSKVIDNSDSHLAGMSGKQPKGRGDNPPPAGSGSAPSGSGMGGVSSRQRQLLAQAAEMEAREKAGQVRQTSSGKPDPTGARSLYAPVDARLQGPVSGQFCAPDPHDAGIFPSSRPRLR